MKQVAVRRVQMAQAKRAPRDGNKIRPHPFAITVRILMGVQRLRTYDRPRAHILPTPYVAGSVRSVHLIAWWPQRCHLGVTTMSQVSSTAVGGGGRTWTVCRTSRSIAGAVGHF